MNNIRKIIEERLENANLDATRYRENDETLNFMKVRGKADAYVDCLNLMQPRTKQELIKEFEKLGWYVANGYSEEYKLVLKRKETKQLYGSLDVDWYHYIFIKENSYRAESTGCWSTKGYNLSMQEHKLLNELFEVWQWC